MVDFRTLRSLVNQHPIAAEMTHISCHDHETFNSMTIGCSGFLLKRHQVLLNNMLDKREIAFESLCDVLSNDRKSRPKLDHATDPYFSRNEDGSLSWDYESYIRRLRAWIAQRDLGAHIIISEQLLKPTIVEETASRFFTKHKIIVTNLNIVAGTGGTLKLAKLPSDEKYPPDSLDRTDEYNGGLQIEFRENRFVAGDPRRNGYIGLNLDDWSHLEFFGNVFERVDAYCRVGLDNCFLLLRGNSFNNRHTTIGGSIPGAASRIKPANWSLSSHHMGQLIGARRVEQMINEDFETLQGKLAKKVQEEHSAQDTACDIDDVIRLLLSMEGKLKVNPENIRNSPAGDAVVRFQDNRFTRLELSGTSKFVFFGKNKIEHFVSKSDPSCIHWSSNQEVDLDGKYGHVHKDLFLALKKHAIEREDKFQELVLSRELYLHEWHLLKRERGFAKSLQDEFVLLTGWLLSNYLTSWMRPLLILLTVNISVAVYVWSGYSSETQFNGTLYVFVELFNPLSNLSQTIGAPSASNSAAISAANIIQKLAYASAVYLIFRVFRRFAEN